MSRIGRKIIQLSLSNLKQLFSPCVNCAFWESHETAKWPPPFCSPQESVRHMEKEEWLALALLKTEGDCAKMLSVDGEIVGFSQYGPAAIFPRLHQMGEARPIGTALISCLRITPEYQEQGHGTVLLQKTLGSLFTRGYDAVEAYASSDPDDSNLADFLLSKGFYIIKANPDYTHLRLERKSTVTDKKAQAEEGWWEKLALPSRAPVPL